MGVHKILFYLFVLLEESWKAHSVVEPKNNQRFHIPINLFRKDKDPTCSKAKAEENGTDMHRSFARSELRDSLIALETLIAKASYK